MPETVYDSRFYDIQQDGSARSAERAIPIISDTLGKPSSVLDVGCGVGTWLAAWKTLGIDRILGVDGDYVRRDSLRIPVDCFLGRDLAMPLDLDQQFDVVMSLEVAEHLSQDSAPQFIETLCRHSDVVIFSAAIPGQGGTNHVNENWPTYWAKHFSQLGYSPYDIIRPKLWQDSEIEFWYAQNILVYATDEAAQRLNLQSTDRPLDLVHPRQLTLALEPLKKPLPKVLTGLARERFAGTRAAAVAKSLLRRARSS